MDEIVLSFPDTIISGNTLTIQINNEVILSIDKDCSNAIAWDNKGTDYSKQLSDAIDNIIMFPHDEKNRLLLVIQQFKDSFSKFGIAGMEGTDDLLSELVPYVGSADAIWKKLKIRYNVKTDRKLKIITYGKAYIFDTPEKCKNVFDSSILRGGGHKVSLTWKMLVKLRGTDPRVQQDVRNAVLFESFISNIVNCIETHDYSFIAIICRAGHHRSVSCAEMLKNLYTNLIIEHLTIDK
jgi:hypothetical protein